MKTKEAIRISNKYGCAFVEGTNSEHWIKAMQEYARIQIEKDRERIKFNEGISDSLETIMELTPIILD